MASSVINQPNSVIAKLSTIAKICKYRGLHREHHFIPMATEVHRAPQCDMDCFIKECVHTRRCTVCPNVIWIVSLGSVFIFSMIDE